MIVFAIIVLALPCLAQNITSDLKLIRVLPFESADEFQEFPGGFVGAAAGTVMIGEIPFDENGLSDGQGVTITTPPGAVELLVFPTFDAGQNILVIRASVQSTGDRAAIGLAALDGSFDGSLGTNIPADSGIYKDGYQRMVLLYNPPGTTVTPVFQVANLHGENDVSVYLDNLEVFLIPEGVQIPSDLFFGANVVDQTNTPTPARTSTPTSTRHAQPHAG